MFIPKWWYPTKGRALLGKQKNAENFLLHKWWYPTNERRSVSKTNGKSNSGEQMLNVPLPPSVKRDLGRISLYNSRTQRRQASLYIQWCVARDMRRIAK